jgi:uncharacterized protein
MNPEIEDQIRFIVEKTTKKAAIEEWKKSSEQQRVPLYNYRFDHVKEVVELAKHIGPTTNADMEVVTLAAWFHDVAKPGLEGIEIRDHGEASAETAEYWMIEQGYSQDMVTRVGDTIRKHVGLKLEKPLEPIEAQVLWESDKILKLGLVGLLQHVLNGIRYTPGQELKDIAKSLREFLPLAQGIADSVVTARGKEIASERMQSLHTLTNMLDSELNLK